MHGHRSEDVDDVQRRSRFAQKDHNWRRILGVWLYIETKAQSPQWKRTEEPRLKKPRQVRSNVKVLLTVVHHEFLPQGGTVNKEYYLEVMARLCKAIHQKRTEL